MPSPLDREPVTPRLIRDDGDWDAIRPQWDALFASSPYASPPLDFTWLRTWWRIYGPTYGPTDGTVGLRIVTAWRGMDLIGAFPLYDCRDHRHAPGLRRLRFLSTGEAEYEETCPDYLDALCRPGEEDACVDAFWACIDGLAWDHLELLNMPAASPLLRGRAPRGRLQTLRRGSCPIADLADGFEAYLGRLSGNGRRNARQLLRASENAGAAFEIVAAGEAERAFDDLVRLHQTRWTAEGQPGVFAAPRFTAFHRELVRAWLPHGRAVLARLAVDGEPIAVLYGFITGSRFDFYQCGVRLDGAGPFRSPGILAHLLLMRALTERGVTTYDFLRGVSDYKSRLATRENALVALQVWRPTLRATTLRSVQHVARLSQRGRRYLFSNSAGLGR